MTRLDRSATVTTALAPLSDRQLSDRLADLVPGSHGIGGPTGTLQVEGVPVFVKQVPITAAELAQPRSTANLFGLPPYYQYGIGSTGFGAWRELAAHELTTSWVRAGRFGGFPLLHHWRILPRPRPERDVAEREQQVATWRGADAVRQRLVAIGESPAWIVLFLEHWPATVHSWLPERIAADGGGEAFEWIDRQLEEAVQFFGDAGLVHFDVHFENVLTDGEQLCFADFGLATHERFELDPDEAAFLARHRPTPADPGYDRVYARSFLARWLVAEFRGARGKALDALLAEAAAGRDLGLPPAAAAVVARHAPLAEVLNGFLAQLRSTGRSTPYPAEALRNVYRRSGVV